jgi:hypothetical protein
MDRFCRPTTAVALYAASCAEQTSDTGRHHGCSAAQNGNNNKTVSSYALTMVELPVAAKWSAVVDVRLKVELGRHRLVIRAGGLMLVGWDQLTNERTQANKSDGANHIQMPLTA